MSFSLEEVLRRVRRTNKSSAGGLSGSNYKTMQAWFNEPDSLAENLTSLFNRIAAGRVPASIIPLLTAGRGVAIPKPSGIGLRPVVVGSIILRFVGTLALDQTSARSPSFFWNRSRCSSRWASPVGASSWVQLLAPCSPNMSVGLMSQPTQSDVGSSPRELSGPSGPRTVHVR